MACQHYETYLPCFQVVKWQYLPGSLAPAKPPKRYKKYHSTFCLYGCIIEMSLRLSLSNMVSTV